MAERKAFASHWKLILASGLKAKKHVSISDKGHIFKGNKILLFCDLSPVVTTVYFKAASFFRRICDWTSVTKNFKIRNCFFSYPFSVGQSKAAKEGPQSVIRTTFLLDISQTSQMGWSLYCSALYTFGSPMCIWYTALPLPRGWHFTVMVQSQNVLNEIKDLPASGKGR